MTAMAIIGGTGFYDLLQDPQDEVVSTPYGEALLQRGEVGGTPVIFLPRHGKHRGLLPHQINYRANIAALARAGVRKVLSTTAVGGVGEGLKVGDLIALDGLVDLSQHRQKSFERFAIDITEPFCPALRRRLLAEAAARQVPLREGGTYACVDGPRYETAQEVRLLRTWGMDVVGQTQGTEAPLAREAGLCFFPVAVVTNMAAGIAGTVPGWAEHRGVMGQAMPVLKALFAGIVRDAAHLTGCGCREAFLRAVRGRGLPEDWTP